MLNYTSKIQHFLNLHRKHTKYIVVLLLLSAFVASFVCSALTEPAVSMTEPIQMGQNVTLLADGDQSDGLPIISGHYENSQFKDYIKWDTQTSTDGRLLGSAHNFALFAFEEINIKTPCYGNLASKKLNVNANFGLENIASAGGQSITIATESFVHGGGAQSKNTVLLVPQNVNFYNEQGNPVTINPIPKVQIKQPDGTTGHFEKGTIDVYAYHVTSGFINFTQEKNNFIALQIWLVEQGNKESNSIIDLNNPDIITRDSTNNVQFSQIKIDNKGVNYLNIDYKNLPTDSKPLNLYLAEDAAVIINVDCKDVTENIKTSFQFREYQNGDEIGNNSEAYLKGTNVLWNFYNSNDTNYQFDKEIHMGNSASGIILAPSSNVYLNSQHTGGVVANKIETSATFTKAMFMTSMESFASGSIAVMAKKNWQNNEIPDGASVQVELYRSKTPNVDITNLPDGEKVGDTLTLNAGNYWNATWFDLDQSYYYYVKELPVSANGKFYEAAYTNNGRNTTGTVDIENSIMEIESGGDNEGGETETPTQTIDITVKIETNPDNLFDNSGTTNPGKNVNIYRSTIPNLTIDQLPTGDHINIEDGNYIDSSKFQNIEFIIGHTEDDKRKSIYITKEMGWQHTFEDQPMFDSNKNPYYYYIIETWHQTNSAVGYENVYLGNGAYLKDSTITMYSIKTIDINVVKNWQNTNDSNPNSVKFEIWRSYTQQQSIPSDAQWVSTNELSSSNSWSAKVENVPISDINNNTYYYYIKETEIENNSSKLNEYDISYSTNDNVYPIYSDKANDANDRHSITESNITITNKKKAADKISITVKKDMRGKDNDYWNNQTFEFTLYQGNSSDNMWSLGEKYQLTKSNNWEITISDLDKNNNGQPYYYRVDETNTPTTFNATYSTEALNAGSVSGNGTIWIYNNPKKVSLNIQKFWDPINIVDKIEYVKIRVYQVKKTDYQMAQTLLLNNSLTFNSYINMLNGSSNPTINGNTVTYTGLTFTTNSPYEVRINLSQFSGKTLNKIEIVFSENAWNDENFIPSNLGTFTCGSGDNQAWNIDRNNVRNNYATNWKNDGTITISNKPKLIVNGDEFVIPAVQNNMSAYSITSMTFTFNEAVGEITPSEPEQDDNTNNTVVLTNPGYDSNGAYSGNAHNYYFDLSGYVGKRITRIEAYIEGFDYNQEYNLLCDSFNNLKNQQSDTRILIKTITNNAFNENQGLSFNNNVFTYVVKDDISWYGSNGRDRLSSISDSGYYLVFAMNSVPNGFQINQLKITFASSEEIHLYDELQFNRANGDGTSSMTENVNWYNITSHFSDYNSKTVTNMQAFFYGLNEEGRKNGTLYQHTFNAYSTDSNGGNISSIYDSSGWTNDFTLTQNYSEENGNKIKGVAVQTRYPNNLQKVVVNYTDGSTFTLHNSNYNGNHETISIPTESTAIHDDDNYHGFNKEYRGQDIEIDNPNLHSKPISSVDMIFKKHLNNAPDWNVYDVWLGSYDNPIENKVLNGNITECTIYSATHYVATWNYSSNPTATVVGARTIYNSIYDVYAIRVNYTDGSTYTIINNNAQVSTSNNIEYGYYFYDNTQLIMTKDSYHTLYIPESFYYKQIQKMEASFKNLSNFNLADDDKNVLDIWVIGTNTHNDFSGNGMQPSQNGDIKTEDYANVTDDKTIQQIGVKTLQHSQNLEYVKVTFTDGSTITIKNSRYGEGGFATGSGNQNTTAAPQQPVITYTTTIYVESAPFVTVSGSDYGKMNNENRVTFTIPEQFKTRIIKSLDITFYNYTSLERKDPNVPYYDSVINVYVDQWSEDWDNNQSGWRENNTHLFKTYTDSKGRGTINYFYVCTAYTQNLEQIVITFTDGSTITISNSGYNANNLATSPTPLPSTTTTPSDGFITEIVLNAQNEWKTTLNQPMVAPDGTIYVYYIIETEIKYKDEYGGETLTGAAINNKFDVECGVLYELKDSGNVLTVTNKLKTTNTTMPSTGGIGTHPYRNAGILMMICSGGIYISLRALRKKQN